MHNWTVICSGSVHGIFSADLTLSLLILHFSKIQKNTYAHRHFPEQKCARKKHQYDLRKITFLS